MVSFIPLADIDDRIAVEAPYFTLVATRGN